MRSNNIGAAAQMRKAPRRQSTGRHARLSILALACCMLSLESHAASFTPLGDLPGGDFTSNAAGVSDDGVIVVGNSSTDPTIVNGELAGGAGAYRWTAAGGMAGLGYPPGTFASSANGISANGAAIVGGANPALETVEAFRWTADDGFISLGYLPDGSGFSAALDASTDGGVVVGESSNGTSNEAFRWTAVGGMVGLGFLSGGGSSTAYAVSDGGGVVVGVSASADGSRAFRWTVADGMVSLGVLDPNGEGGSTAHGVSPDGNIVVGQSQTSGTGPYEAFRWTSVLGMVGLGDLPGGDNFSRASAVSADGDKVVGASSTANGQEAFLWTPQQGMQRLLDVLVAGGASNLAGWTLTGATGISADGQWIVGTGRNPQGDTEAFLTNITPVPVPAPLWSLGSALALLGWLRHRALPIRSPKSPCA